MIITTIKNIEMREFTLKGEEIYENGRYAFNGSGIPKRKDA